MGNQTSISKEEIKKVIRRKLREEEEARSHKILEDLASASDKQSEGELPVFAGEKSLLPVFLKSEEQVKTLCFKPRSSKDNQREGLDAYSFKSDPIEEDDDCQDIKKFKKELRTRFENTSSFPFSVTGIVRVDLGEGKLKTATGILIGPNFVLTAAHNVCCKKTLTKYSKIEFIPGINEDEIPFGTFHVVESYVPDEFLKVWGQEDYALLVLQGVAGLEAGYFGLHIASKALLKGKELNVIGYPGYVRTKDERNKLKYLSRKGRHQLWGMKGQPEYLFFEEGEDEKFLINYADILTSPGQSGSGVFYYDKDTDGYYVIGVHVLGNGDGENGYNSATWITRKRFNLIEEWVSKSRRKLIKDRELQIKSVNLSISFIGDEGLEYLSAYLMSKLENLYLAGNNISNKGVRILCEQSKWSELKCLNLADNHLTEEGAAVLGKSKCWTKLEKLSLHNNQLRDVGTSILGENETWTNLKQLILSSNEIHTKGLNGLMRNKSWIHLEELSLRTNRIGEEAKITIEANRTWENLKVLDLGVNKLGDREAEALEENSSWRKLEVIRLDSNRITNKGAMTKRRTIFLIFEKYELACYFPEIKDGYSRTPHYAPDFFFRSRRDTKVKAWHCEEHRYGYLKIQCDLISKVQTWSVAYIYDLACEEEWVEKRLEDLKKGISIYKNCTPSESKFYLVGSSKLLQTGKRSILEEIKKYGDTIGAKSFELGADDEDGEKLLEELTFRKELLFKFG